MQQRLVGMVEPMSIFVFGQLFDEEWKAFKAERRKEKRATPSKS